MMNTIIAGAAGGLISALLKPFIFRTYSHNMRYDISALCNGTLGGLVSITGACNNVQPVAAFFIGLGGGIVYCFGARLCILVEVDDPIEASAVHGFCGVWGLIAVGIFDNTKGLLYGTESIHTRGVFFWV
jgi:Amt family ammonium transporter